MYAKVFFHPYTHIGPITNRLVTTIIVTFSLLSSAVYFQLFVNHMSTFLSLSITTGSILTTDAKCNADLGSGDVLSNRRIGRFMIQIHYDLYHICTPCILLIFFCNWSTEYSRASADGGQPGT